MVEHESQSAGAWTRRGRQVGGAALIAVGLASLLSAWVYEQAGPRECRGVARSDLSLEQMGSVKRRIDQLERDPAASLALTGEEMTFVLADNLAFPVSITVDGAEVAAEFALKEIGTERCYHVDYRGGLVVDGGVAILNPSHLAVGRLDLTRWFAGRSVRVAPGLLLGPQAGRLLSQVRTLRVSDDELQLEIDDVASLNPRRAAQPSVHAER